MGGWEEKYEKVTGRTEQVDDQSLESLSSLISPPAFIPISPPYPPIPLKKKFPSVLFVSFFQLCLVAAAGRAELFVPFVVA